MADIIVEALGGSFHNPVADKEDEADLDPGLTDAQAKRVREDTNAVVCPDWFGRTRKLLSRPDGRPSALVQSLPYLAIFRVVGAVLHMSRRLGDLSQPSESSVLYIVGQGTFWIFAGALTLTVYELRSVLRDRGEIERLGAGSSKISMSALASLNRQRKLMRAVQLILAGSGIGWATGGLVSIVKQAVTTRFSTADQWAFWGFSIVPVGIFLLVEGVLFVELLLSMQVGSTLAADAVLDVVHAVRATSPEDTDAWESAAVQPALALSNGAVGHLSRGWSQALALSFFGMWTMALGIFGFMLYLLNIWPEGVLVFSPALFGCLVLPLVMSSAVAAVSTSCDDLLSSINERRIENLDLGPRLYQLEVALKNLNNAQGLGFIVFENVLDKKKLRTMYVSIIGVFSTLIPVMLAYSSDGQNTVHYGSFENRPDVYAFNAESRTFIEATDFCKGLWMTPAVLRSMEEADAMYTITNGKSAWVGASRDAFDDPAAPTSFVWDDPYHPGGTPWWYHDEENIGDWDSVGELQLNLLRPDPEKPSTFDAAYAEKSMKASLCFAPSITSLKGALPPIISLGLSPGAAVRHLM